MTDKLEMPIEQFAEAVAKENARLNKHIEKLEAALREIEYLDRPQVRGLPRRIEIADIARKALEGKDD